MKTQEQIAKEVFFEKERPKRTSRQNRSLHLFFRLLKDELNAAGLDQRVVLKPGVQIPWTERAVKEQLWRPLQKAITQKESTTDLDTFDITKIYEPLSRHFGEKFGIHVEFPNEKATEAYFKRLKDEDPC